MPTRLNPYLGFRDNTREAMEFYHSVLGGELTMSTFADFGLAEDPAEADKIMHAQITGSNDLVLMAADTPNAMDFSAGSAHSVSLSGVDDAELRGYWAGLSEGATILEPLEVAPWGDAFGMLIDRFGVRWFVNIAADEA